MGLMFVNGGVSKPWADQIAPGQRGADSTGMPQTVETNAERLARFQQDYHAPDRDAVLASMQEPQSSAMPQPMDQGGITGDMGKKDLLPAPPSVQEGAGMITPKSFTLSPGAGGWSMDGGQPMSVNDLLTKIASSYGGQLPSSGGVTSNGGAFGKVANAVMGKGKIGVPAAGGTQLGGAIGGAMSPIGGRLASDPSRALIGALGF